MDLDFSKNQRLALVALIGICAIGLSVRHAHNTTASGGVQLQEPGSSAQTRVVTSDPDSIPTNGDSRQNANTGNLTVQVAGCVRTPGVYSLGQGQRVIDAINAAGGAADNADMQAVNLAEKVEDGEKIVLPPKQMTEVASPTPATTQTATARSGASETSKVPERTRDSAFREDNSSKGSGKLKSGQEGTVSLNTATIDELQRIPGIGPSTAQKILDYRKQIGRFTSPEQLMSMRGIGPKKFEKIRPFVSL